MRRLVAALTAGTALVAGCSSKAQPSDELQVSDKLEAATAAISPGGTAAPAGTVLPVKGEATAIAADDRSRLLAVAIKQPPSVLLYGLDTPEAQPRTIALPAPVDTLTVAGEGGVLFAALGSARQVVRIDLPSAQTTAIPVDGSPGSASQAGARTLVAVRDRKAIDILEQNRPNRQVSGEMFSADQVLPVGGGAVVLDRLRTAVFDVDIDAGKIGAGQRAGAGATNATTDRFGRVLVTDTRGGALLAFSTSPVLLRQRYPVPGAPYGIAYDPKRDLVWVTLTERNEVVGYNIAGGEPREQFRFPTVVQPNSVTVDPASGRVFVASATGGGVQVMRP